MLANLARRSLCILGLALTTAALSACEKGSAAPFTVPPSALQPGGVFVAFVNGCEQGCEQIERGDLIQSIDGKPVKTRADLEASGWTDGQAHDLEIRRGETTSSVQLVAEGRELPPLTNIPPLWTVGAAELNAAPEWARRRMFGHASPLVDLINVDGGFVTGRSLHGKRHFIVYFDWATSTQQQDASMFLQVAMQAQPALNAKGFEVIFAQVPFPGRQRPPMGDTDLRNFHDENANKAKDLPPIAMYRLARAKEKNTAREVGLEGGFSVMENLGQSPEIVILDEHGIVRWHSAGLEPDPNAKLTDQLYTIDAAAQWALDVLGATPPTSSTTQTGAQ